jgi:3-deoxy-D-arabino-heptulosonate 7-phosphate (DAHP) synthase
LGTRSVEKIKPGAFLGTRHYSSIHILKVTLYSKLGLEVGLKNVANTEFSVAMDACTAYIHPEAWL